MPKITNQKICRILDANFNRAKEGLRVCEDISRFVWNDAGLTKNFKTVRHQLTQGLLALGFKRVLAARDIDGDVGRGSLKSEFKRKNVSDIFYANSQRVKESIRVLEEFAKLVEPRVALKFKKLRYQIYALEKRIAK